MGSNPFWFVADFFNEANRSLRIVPWNLSLHCCCLASRLCDKVIRIFDKSNVVCDDFRFSFRKIRPWHVGALLLASSTVSSRAGAFQLLFRHQFHQKIYIWIRGTSATYTHETDRTNTLQQLLHEKNILLAPGFKPTTMSSCLGSTFLTGICISPIDHFAPIGSLYSGWPRRGHENCYCSHLLHYPEHVLPIE